MKAILVIALAAIVVGSSSAGEQDQCSLSGHYCLSALVVKTGVTLDKSNCNKTFAMESLASKPLVQYKDAEENEQYTFLILSQNPVVHWAVGNIPGSALKEAANLDGYKKLAYHKSMNAKDFNSPQSYLYHYLLYRQTKQNDTAPIHDIHKYDFDLHRYVWQHKLCLVAGLLAWVSEESTKSKE